MDSKSETNGNQFEKDYDEVLKKLNRLTRNSEVIKKVLEKRLDTIGSDQIMVVLQEIVPKAIQDLSHIYRFLNKYGYDDHVEQIEKNDRPKKGRTEQT